MPDGIYGLNKSTEDNRAHVEPYIVIFGNKAYGIKNIEYRNINDHSIKCIFKATSALNFLSFVIIGAFLAVLSLVMDKSKNKYKT